MLYISKASKQQYKLGLIKNFHFPHIIPNPHPNPPIDCALNKIFDLTAAAVREKKQTYRAVEIPIWETVPSSLV